MPDLDFNFEVFKGRAQPAYSGPTISLLGKRGKINLNNASFEALGKPEYVELLFDHKKNAIGLRAVKRKEKHTYPIQQHTSAKSFVISAYAFFKHCNIDNSSKRYEPVLVKNVLVVELNGPFDLVDRSSRTKALTGSQLHALDKHVAS